MTTVCGPSQSSSNIKDQILAQLIVVCEVIGEVICEVIGANVVGLNIAVSRVQS